ncbi:MAG: transglutaminase-like domain-containing protein [Coprobacillus sp.]
MKAKRFFFFSCFISLCLSVSGCASDTPSAKPGNGTRDNTPVVLEPLADNQKTFGNNKITFDVSHSDEGYVMVKYSGDNPKVKVQIKNPNENTPYTYDILEGYNVFPLTGGDGDYVFQAFENAHGNTYNKLYTKQYSIKLKNEYTSFLYPNQYVNYNKNTKAIQKGQEIASGSDTDLDVVARVYDYIIANISYDDDKAKKAKDGEMAGYLPEVDYILESEKGICFDYAALMATMLRTQNIPTRMLIGNVKTNEGNIYHAWIGVYIKDIGWVDNFIEFDGKNWSMMDPTFASDNNNSDTIKDFITNKDNYSVKYMY